VAIKAKLKLHGSIPWSLEHKLISGGGFRVFARRPNEWVILEKTKSPFKPEILINGELPEDVQQILITRCNRIVNMFMDPEAHKFVIRTRLENIARTLPPQQKKFVKTWIDNNVGEC
jgi:hypothetical protein